MPAPTLAHPARSRHSRKARSGRGSDLIFPAPLVVEGYTRATVLDLFGFSAQSLYQSGLAQALEPVEIGGAVLYPAATVQAWVRRVARLRLRQALGEIKTGTRQAALLQAPADAERDTTCPKCGSFAQTMRDGGSLCLNRHLARPRRRPPA